MRANASQVAASFQVIGRFKQAPCEGAVPGVPGIVEYWRGPKKRGTGYSGDCTFQKGWGWRSLNEGC